MVTYKDINSRKKFASLIKVPLQQLTYIVYKIGIDECYETFLIPKKRGGNRVINSPKENLKKIQLNMYRFMYDYHMDYISNNNMITKVSFGFEKNKDIIQNAKIHKNKKIVLNIDLKDFFDSFHFGRVRGFFNKSKEFGFPEDISTFIAQLLCYKSKLPQGAPTSPLVTNLIFNSVDLKILKLAKKYKLDYTRYADDLTFSTNYIDFNDYYDQFIIEIDTLLKEQGFNINYKKINVKYNYERQIVTGVTVNKKLNAHKNFIKNTRAMANSLYKNGEFFIDKELGTRKQLEGRFAFINTFDKYNNSISKKYKSEDKDFSIRLNSREKEYQKFLFYNYFYSPELPTIFCEGKTDILHIKAAIKSEIKNYVNEENFLLRFINRDRSSLNKEVSKISRFKFFFNIEDEGADTLKNILDYYTDGNYNKKNLYKFFSSNNCKCTNPVIIILDYELKSKNKPVGKFITEINTKSNNDKKNKKDKTQNDIRNRIENDLKNKGYTNIIGNLYLIVTKSSVNPENDAEIEDLHTRETLGIEINGMKFDKKNNSIVNGTYGKNQFAKYVYNNYENIDFSGFKNLLDAINEIVENHKNQTTKL